MSDDIPQRIVPADFAKRYKITKRLAGDWIRAATYAGVLKKLRGVHVGRWSKVDAWVESGGEIPGGHRLTKEGLVRRRKRAGP